MKLHKPLHERGFGHILLMALVIIIVAAIGTYLLTRSHADPLCNVSGVSSVSTMSGVSGVGYCGSTSGVSTVSGPASRSYMFLMSSSRQGTVTVCRTNNRLFMKAEAFTGTRLLYWFDAKNATVIKLDPHHTRYASTQINGKNFNAVITGNNSAYGPATFPAKEIGPC